MVRKKGLLFSSVALMAAVSSYAAQEQVINIQNMLRIGVDDNVYLRSDAVDSAWMADVFNISGTLRLSGATEATFSYQPEVRWRFDADPEMVQYHNAYAELVHEMSQNLSITLSDDFRYQLKDGQSGAAYDANFFQNELLGSVNWTLDQLTQLNVGAGYEFRTWDDDAYGVVSGNNYDQYVLNLSAIRSLKKNTQGVVSLNYVGLEYDGSRGTADITSVMGGLDHKFGSNLSGYSRVGASVNNMDGVASSGSATTPYLTAGLDYAPTDKTSLRTSLDYSTRRANNSVYNLQEELGIRTALKHQLTAKIRLSGTLSYIFSTYASDYAILAASGDAEDAYFKIGMRGSYQINRNNFIELGYEYTDRSTDVLGLQDYERNRVDLGWRVRM